MSRNAPRLRPSSLRREAGVALVELAVVTLATILVSGGFIAFSLHSYEETVLVEALHVGLRAAAIQEPGTPPDVLTSRIQSSVEEFIRESGSNPALFVVSIAPESLPIAGEVPRSGVHVSVERLANQVTVMGKFISSTKCFSGSTILRGGNTALEVRTDGIEGC